MSFWRNLKLAVVTRILSMSVITVFAVLVMIAMNMKGRKIQTSEAKEEDADNRVSVSVKWLETQPVEQVRKYSGTIRPMERYLLSFKSAGRVVELGKNKEGRELDEGDLVTEDMVLAKLDLRLLNSQKEELTASRNLAKKEYDTASQLSTGAISQTELNRKQAEYEIAEAKLNSLLTQIEDGVLKSKVQGVISKRLVKAGEAVNPGQPVFELIQVDQVKLVVGVPESQVGGLIRNVRTGEPLQAYVELIGNELPADSAKEKSSESESDGDERPTKPNGTVFRVGQTSDDKSGLFEVEILMDNKNGFLRPGMIAIARIIVDNVNGFRLPVDAAFFQESTVFVFGVVEDGSDWKAKKETLKPKDYFVQENEKTGKEELVALKLSENVKGVIVSGHRRLVDGQKVGVIDPE